MLALSNSQQIFDVRLTLLLHDIGKPFSYQTDGEIRHYKGHPEKSKIMAYEILKRLGYEEKYIEKICFYIENHDTEIKDELIKNSVWSISNHTVRIYVRRRRCEYESI